MNLETIPIDVQHRYPEACIRGPKITRSDERDLGYFRFDASTAWDLGTNNVGVFVGGCEELDRIIERIMALELTSPLNRWVVVVSSKEVAALIVQHWFRRGTNRRVATTTLKLPQNHVNVILATPESLKRVSAGDRATIAGIVVLDPLCHIHKLRGIGNDRPQHVAKFRNDIAIGNWLPPIFLLTNTPAKSVETASIGSAYSLDAWWFIDGKRLKCGPQPPIVADVSELDS